MINAPHVPLSRRFAVAFAFLAATAALATGCTSREDAARTRAASEFRCHEDDVGLREMTAGTYDVEACGHHARYTCIKGRHHTVSCIREPVFDDTLPGGGTAPAARSAMLE